MQLGAKPIRSMASTSHPSRGPANHINLTAFYIKYFSV